VVAPGGRQSVPAIGPDPPGTLAGTWTSEHGAAVPVAAVGSEPTTERLPGTTATVVSIRTVPSGPRLTGGRHGWPSSSALPPAPCVF
jgi:hypothetical protein